MSRSNDSLQLVWDVSSDKKPDQFSVCISLHTVVNLTAIVHQHVMLGIWKNVGDKKPLIVLPMHL